MILPTGLAGAGKADAYDEDDLQAAEEVCCTFVYTHTHGHRERA